MPKRVRVKLKKCIQNQHEVGSKDAHMISRIFYELVVNGKTQGSFYSDIKQPVGSEYVAEDLEVTAPNGYEGPFDQASFAKGIRNYYQRIAGSKRTKKNNTIVLDAKFAFDADG
jgi:hypothetical protein